MGGSTLHFETEFNGLPDSLHEFIQRSALSVTTGKLRDRTNIQAFFVPFDDHVELPHT